MRIQWLPEAVDDLDRIDAFWRGIYNKLAKRAAVIILDLALSLNDFPDRGRASRIPGTRETVGKFGAGAFILRYQPIEGGILVVQVKHSKARR